ncbi:hypothetical protein HAHE_29380 [Haloferula helveola]|uniref:Peptidase S54 rhomboid domain-containing protein n=1 Tax=Haloferula helveola TaxID=490095 RepID=A0ABM7RBN9_9BACT|nr:hypothetical protein HAHE_29380 [Haloferula helveola]
MWKLQGPLLVLIVLMFLIFFVQSLPGSVFWVDRFMAIPGEVVQSWDDIRSGVGRPDDWWELGTLLSCVFLHADIQHVGMNMLFMWIFAALFVELLGWRWMLLVFLTTGIAGSLTHVILNREDFIPMLGASGAVMGFEGAYLGLATRFRLPDPHVWPMARPIPPARLALLALIGVGIDYFSLFSGQQEGIAYGAHIGGFTMGLLIAGIAAPRPRLALN